MVTDGGHHSGEHRSTREGHLLFVKCASRITFAPNHIRLHQSGRGYDSDFAVIFAVKLSVKDLLIAEGQQCKPFLV